jgi:hypothetical protein
MTAADLAGAAVAAVVVGKGWAAKAAGKRRCVVRRHRSEKFAPGGPAEVSQLGQGE